MLVGEGSRAGFYRSLKDRGLIEESEEMRSAIQQIALEHRRRCGYRRVTAEIVFNKRDQRFNNHHLVSPSSYGVQRALGSGSD